MNIAAHLARAGRHATGRPAVALGARTLLTYGELAGRAAKLAAAMRRRLEPGEPVALVMANCPEYLEVLYACWHAGLIAVPVNAKLHRNELAYILADSQARLCFATPALAPKLSGLADTGLKDVIDVSTPEYAAMLTADPMPLSEVPAKAPAWLFYTSGTTGQPKGATLSHHNLRAMSWCYFADVDRQSPWAAILHAAPMSHGSGMYALPHVMQASCQVIPESGGFDPAEIFESIAAWPNLVFFAAPTMVKRLLDHHADTDTANLKTILYGGGPMYTADSIAAIERFGPKLAQLYGQGETPMTITALPARFHAQTDHPRWLERLASVGIAQSAVEVRAAGADSRPLGPGETGEILVRGETVMSGYWRNAQATAETLRGGWLHTGDMGCFDEDGFLTLKDRARDVIISGGSNIYPREVEDLLLRHGSVAEAAVIGRADREWGEAVVAYVVPQTGAEIDRAALDRFCIDNIARFKRPRIYRTIDELPKNNYGKILKRVLRELESRSPA